MMCGVLLYIVQGNDRTMSIGNSVIYRLNFSNELTVLRYFLVWRATQPLGLAWTLFSFQSFGNIVSHFKRSMSPPATTTTTTIAGHTFLLSFFISFSSYFVPFSLRNKACCALQLQPHIDLTCLLSLEYYCHQLTNTWKRTTKIQLKKTKQNKTKHT